MDEQNEETTKVSKMETVKKIVASKAFQFGGTVVLTAVATALVARSELFSTADFVDAVES